MESTTSGIARPTPYRAAHTEAFRDEIFQSLVESLEDYGIIMLAPDGAIQTWNAGAARIFGYTEHEIAGQSIDLLYTSDEDINAARKMTADLERAQRDGRCEGETWRMR